jgi:inorganic pyrophosphatase
VDDKVLSVPLQDPHYAEVQSLRDLPDHLPREIEHFFRTYKELEGKHVTSLGWESREAAEEAIRAGAEAARA